MRAVGVVVAEVLALGLAVSACGGSDDSSGASRSSTAAATASTPGPTSTGSPGGASSAGSASGSSDPSVAPSVAPATGDAVTLATMTFRLPEGWRVNTGNEVTTAAFDPSTAHGSVQVFDQSSFGGETLDSQARLSLGTAERTGMHPTRQADITVDGVEGYVITGADATYPVYYVFGTVDHGHNVTMIFQYSRNTPQAQPTIASVLASVSWT